MFFTGGECELTAFTSHSKTHRLCVGLWWMLVSPLWINIHDEVAGLEVSVSCEVSLSDHVAWESARQKTVKVNLFLGLYIPKTVTCSGNSGEPWVWPKYIINMGEERSACTVWEGVQRDYCWLGMSYQQGSWIKSNRLLSSHSEAGDRLRTVQDGFWENCGI